MKKMLAFMLVLAILLTLVGCTSQNSSVEPSEESTGIDQSEEKESVKVALVMSGPINDGGWNTQAYEGLLAIEDKYGYETSYTENAKIDSYPSILRDYARNGFDIIIGHGFDFGDSLPMVAAEFPDVYFAQVGGESGGSHSNLTSGVFRSGELGYVAGRLLAELTKTGKIGFVGGMEIPTIADEVATIIATVEKYNPDAQVTVTYTGSWTDVAAAKEAAKAMIANGVDSMVGIGDATDVGSIQAALEAEVPVWYVGWSGDRYDLGPNVVATSAIQDVGALMDIFVQRYIAGENGIAGVYGIKEGVQFFGKFGDGFPDEIKQLAIEEYDKFTSGEYTRNSVMDMIGRVPEVTYDE